MPEGYRIYAIGDIHGRDDLLGPLLGKIEAELHSARTTRSIFVFLGDLIDRGPFSAEVIQRLSSYKHENVKSVFLQGNHEEAFLRVLNGEPDLLHNWLRFGGDAFVRSYGLGADDLRRQPEEKAIAAIRSAVPSEHVHFLRRFHDSFRAGDYFFAHAGARPGIPLDQQTPADLRWIRAPFLEHAGPHEAVVVHGHTITETIDERPHRIGIDTGAYKTGILTALALEGTDRWTLEATL